VVSADITKPETLKDVFDGVDTVFHCAAMLGPANAPKALYEAVNVQGTAHVMAAAARSGSLERFVHISSVGVLGPLKPKEVAEEGTPPRPVDIYEKTKLAAEERVLSSAKDGFPAVIARPAWIYGPRDRRTLKLIRSIAKKRFLFIGKASNKQHPVWIGDVVEGVIKCAVVTGIEGRVYHLAGPEFMSVEKLCRLIAEAAGVRIPSLSLPFAPVYYLASGIEILWKILGREPPVDHRKIDFFRIQRAYSIKRAREELKWIPQMSFREGILRTVEWYRKQGWL